MQFSLRFYRLSISCSSTVMRRKPLENPTTFPTQRRKRYIRCSEILSVLKFSYEQNFAISYSPDIFEKSLDHPNSATLLTMATSLTPIFTKHNMQHSIMTSTFFIFDPSPLSPLPNFASLRRPPSMRTPFFQYGFLPFFFMKFERTWKMKEKFIKKRNNDLSITIGYIMIVCLEM